MSADDFQTKYSSVMESMLKSAVAETTKLFESMVDELKAEILKLKKENEDLRQKYSQVDNAEKRVPLHTGASETPPGKSHGCDRRDRATQCDIVSLRTMLVEECEPLKESSLQNPHEQWLYEDIEYDLQEHNYVSHREADSQRVYIQVKKEDDDCSMLPALKEEEDEPILICGKVVSNEVLGSLPTSASGTENKKTQITQEFLTERIPLPHSNEEAAMALEISSSQMASGLQVEDPSSEAQHSIVISLPAVKDNLEEECDISVNISKIGTELSTSVQHPSTDQQPIENDQTLVLPQHCQREGERPVNKQIGVADEKLADSTSCYTHMENEPQKTSMTEGKSSHQPVHHKRGRSPNGGKHVQQVEMEQSMVTSPLIRVEDVQISSSIDAINATVSKSLNVSKVKSKKVLSIVTRSAQRRVNTASEENVDKSEVGTLSVSEVFIRKECSTNKEKASASQQLSMEKNEAEFQAPSKKVTYATETNPLQTQFLEPTPCPTQVNIQDAMLLVEAMNQSSVENNLPSPQTLAAAPQGNCGHLVGKLQTLDNNTNKFPNAGVPILGKLTDMSTSNLSKVETPKDHNNTIHSALHIEFEPQPTGHIPNPQNVPVCNYITLPVPFSKAATQTSIESLKQLTVAPLSVAPSKPKNSTPQKIIVVPRSTSLILPHKVAALSSSQLSSVVTTPPLSSIPQKTIYVTFPSHSPVTSRNQQREKLKLINPKQFQPQSCVLTTKQDSATPTSNVQTQTNSPVLALRPFGSLSQELKDSLKAKTTSNVLTLISKETYNTSHNLESPKQTSIVLEKENGLETGSISNKPNGQAVASVFSVKQPGVEQKFSAMVRLTRLPFPLTNQESVLVSELISGKSSKPQSVLKGINTPRHPSGMPQLSTDICRSLKETPVVPVKPCNEEVNCVLEMASASCKTSILEDSQDNSCLQKFTSSSVSAPSISMTETSETLSNQDKEKHSHAVQNFSLPSYQKNTVTSNDASDPHLQMSKAQFLAQLAVSPIQEPEKVSNNDQSGGTFSVEKSLNTTSLVARLRRHLRAHLPVRKPVANSEPCMETDATTASLKQPLPFSPNSGPSPKSTNSNSESPKRKVTSTDSISPRNTKSISVNPSRKNISKEASKNTISTCVTSKMAITDRETPQNTNTTSENTSSTEVSLKRTNSTTDNSSPKKTIFSSVSPKMSKNISERMTGNFRRSSFPKLNPSTKLITREPISFNIKRFSATTDGALTKKAETETVSPSSSVLAKDCVRSMRTRVSTYAKKPRISPDGVEIKNKLRAANAKKLAIAKAKTIAKIRNSKQQMQNGSKISQVAGNQANSEAVKKITCKAVWIPPKMPIVKTPKKERGSMDFTAVYPPNNSVHSIPVKAPPVVSPLQPLLVIGGHLLKNQCGECGRILSSSAALESHVGLHTGRRPFSCTLCGKSFPDSKGLKRHGRVHRNGRIHVCPQCGKGFVYRFGLNKHLQMVHGKLKPFVCQICNKGFYTKRDVEAHIRIHTGEKPFHCNLCEKKFTRRVELNVHLRWHNGEKRHWCPYCGKGFLDFNNLKRHKYIHTGEKPHSCPHCPKRFTQSGHLKKHVKNVHKIK